VKVAALRRYPVKSMGGESLDLARFDARGLEGDRWFAVEDAQGHFASGKNTRRFRRRDRVFDFSARTTPPGQVVVTDSVAEWPAGSADLNQHLSTVMDCDVKVRTEGDVPHQDAGAVSLVSTATLRWCAERWGVDSDPRRLRVNIVFEADEPFVEESWTGCTVSVGSVRLHIVGPATRCRMIDIAQDGVTPRTKWLKPLTSERDMALAMYAQVITPGECAVDDRLTLTTTA